MITIYPVDLNNRKDVNRFIEFEYQLYRDHPYWVPPFRIDVKGILNPKTHPFYKHSSAEFFLAIKDGVDVGRICVLVNNSYNSYKDVRWANFYFWDFIDDSEVAKALLNTAEDWAREQGMEYIVGPKGFSIMDFYGIQTEGFEEMRTMNITSYNYPYYQTHIEAAGYTKEIDFISYAIRNQDYKLDERVFKIAERIKERQKLKVVNFKSKFELLRWSNKIGKAYNTSFGKNWEFSPLSEAEMKNAFGFILFVADHKLIKIIVHEDEVVGFLLPFPDASAAIKRHDGRLFPFGGIAYFRELPKATNIIFNGVGILPKYQGRGGNALLYVEIEKTLRDIHERHHNLTQLEMVQIAETAEQMRRDVEMLGGRAFKRFRVYKKAL